ncbi:uncharacterized protein KY384_005672 [Bacidia gigantensis]|uniref:uncharacterized protein n=1 Tax=Bacidia gigantensis TaxID=2732470 RepID=UPI001D05BEEC|nr:uncharacterized protein KY384_005672 [Bacidia gigantensis]KAG8529038.1 hypothetical protein KY384_005672 [Bacidia gigantensis]
MSALLLWSRTKVLVTPFNSSSQLQLLSLVQDEHEIDFENAITKYNEQAVKGTHREKDRKSSRDSEALREEAEQGVAGEYLSALFRQRATVDGSIRKILPIMSWVSNDSNITAKTMKPVVSTVIIKGNALDIMSAKTNFSDLIQIIEPMTMSPSNTVVVDGEIKGRWAGWMTLKELKRTKIGNHRAFIATFPAARSCLWLGTERQRWSSW